MISMHLYELLKKKGMSQKEFVELTKIPKNTVSSYCNNSNTMINKEYLNSICKTLNCDTNNIVKYTDDAEYEAGKNNRFSSNYYSLDDGVDLMMKTLLVSGAMTPNILEALELISGLHDEKLLEDFKQLIYDFIKRTSNTKNI